jgi:hypothetical protein
MSTMRYRIEQLRLVFPQFNQQELVHIYNLARNHRGNQNRLNKLAQNEHFSSERDERGISIATSNIECTEWAIEFITGRKFQIVDWIVNEEIEEIIR